MNRRSRTPVAHHRPCVVLRVIAEKAIFDRSRATRGVGRPGDRGPRTDGGWCVRRNWKHVEERPCRVEPCGEKDRGAFVVAGLFDVHRRARHGAAWAKFELEDAKPSAQGAGAGVPGRVYFQGWDTGNAIRVAPLRILVQAGNQHGAVRALHRRGHVAVGEGSSRSDAEPVACGCLEVPTSVVVEEDLPAAWQICGRRPGEQHVGFLRRCDHSVRCLEGLRTVASPAPDDDNDGVLALVQWRRRLHPDGIGTPVTDDLPAGPCERVTDELVLEPKRAPAQSPSM